MDPYVVLEIDRNADENTIKRRHIIVSPKSIILIETEATQKEEKFKQIGTAYSMLTDNEFKGFSNFSSAYTADGKFDFSKFEGLNIPNILSSVRDKFFSEAKLFTKFFNEKNNKARQRDANLDVLVNLRVDLYDIYFGTIRNVKLNIRKKCRTCMSLGMKVYDSGEINTCNECNGLKNYRNSR